MTNPTDKSAYEEARESALEEFLPDGRPELDAGGRALFRLSFRAGYTAGRESREGEIARLRERIEAAEAYIAESPCDPDIYPEQLKAYQRWQALQESDTDG